MVKHWVSEKKTAATPIIAVLVLVLLYGLSQKILLNDEGIDIALIARFDTRDLRDEKAQPEEKKSSHKLIAERYSGRLTWVFLIAVSMLVCIGALAVSTVLIHKSLGSHGKRAFLITCVCVVVSTSLGIVFWLEPDLPSPIMRMVQENTILKGEFGMPIVFDVMKFINAFTYAAAFSLVFASCAILLPRECEASKNHADLPKGLANIADQARELRIVLYAGTLLLIIGTLRMTVITQWSLAFISPEAVDGAKSFFTTLVTVNGGFYTLVLAAIYLPAMKILEIRAQAIATNSFPPDQRKTALDSAGVSFSLRETLPRVLAVLGPLLAGPVGELFKGLIT